MSIKWREREHEAVDDRVLENLEAEEAQRNCGLLKFFMCPSLHSQHDVLQLLISYWDVDLAAFCIDDEVLHLEVEDIYFITGLSRRGAVVDMNSRRGFDMLSIDEYILT